MHAYLIEHYLTHGNSCATDCAVCNVVLGNFLLHLATPLLPAHVSMVYLQHADCTRIRSDIILKQWEAQQKSHFFLKDEKKLLGTVQLLLLSRPPLRQSRLVGNDLLFLESCSALDCVCARRGQFSN